MDKPITLLLAHARGVMKACTEVQLPVYIIGECIVCGYSCHTQHAVAMLLILRKSYDNEGVYHHRITGLLLEHKCFKTVFAVT